ncbi:unnamed protein product, partial [Didymodactylos carnosus]
VIHITTGDYRDTRQCQLITYHECKNIGYNMSSLPNKFNHQDQKDVAMVINQYTALLGIGCSSDLRFFLCSIYLPLCISSYSETIPPCREVCERVKKPCEPYIHYMNKPWPDQLDCEQFPWSRDNAICMDPRKNDQTSNPFSNPSPSPSLVAAVDQSSLVQKKQSPSLSNIFSDKTSSSSQRQDNRKCCTCNETLGYRLLDKSDLYYDVQNSIVSHCSSPCRSPYFQDEKSQLIIQLWLTFWAGLCCISCIFVLGTFCMNTSRFRYPQRPIVFLALCYFFVSCGYIIRLILGHENVGCHLSSSYHASSTLPLRLLIPTTPIYLQLTQVSGPSNCTLVFVLIYYFSMSSCIWWIILTLTWFLAACFKWGEEAVANYSIYYHLIAWMVPCIQTIAILMVKGIDGDPVAGICYVGITNSYYLKIFVLVPLIFYLSIGSIFLLAGLISLIRIRNVMKIQDKTKIYKLEKLMCRIGIFSVLYILPAIIVIACYFYELYNRSTWEETLLCSSLDCNSDDSSSSSQTFWSQPSFSLYMAKYFFILVVGTTTGLWINLNGKTMHTWKHFFCRCYFHHSNQMSYYHKHTKINGSKYSLPSSKQIPITHV